MLGWMVNEAIAEWGWAHLWSDLHQPGLSQGDVLLINLGCALANHKRQWSDAPLKSVYLPAKTSAVQFRQVGRVGVASLANNHAGDFDSRCPVRAATALDDAGIVNSGTGRSWLVGRFTQLCVGRGSMVRDDGERQSIDQGIDIPRPNGPHL